MLFHLKELVDNGYIAIVPKDNEKLIEQLRVAKSDEFGKFDKSQNSLDAGDALMLAMQNFKFR